MKSDKIKELAAKVLKIEIIRFGIVGVIATAIHYGIYLLLKQVMDINISYSIGYLISLACNFYLTARFTFQTGTSLALPFFGIGMKTDLFQPCGHC